MLNGQSDDSIRIKYDDPGIINIFSYGIDVPGGDMKQSFGYNFRFGISPSYYFSNSNISAGISFDYIFGYKVRINPVSNLLTEDGQLINSNSGSASLNLSERGIVAGLYISKVFQYNREKPRTGIRIDLGPYFLCHWIHYNDESGTIPQLSGDYKKGYDRFTGGFAFKEFIGFQHLSQRSKISFTAGFEFFQGFTKSYRHFNYSDASVDNKKKNDFMSGIKVGWILPLYIIKNPEEIYY
ncbi:MAG: hypothetical protein ACM3PT_10485 [Deltaproteobacteria bacterium]